MGVIGEVDVREQAASGRRHIVVGPNDLLTAQAREAIVQLGLEVLSSQPPPAERPVTDPATTTRRVLARRSPRWISPAPRQGAKPVKLGKVTIVGSGNVGATTGHLVSMNGMAHELVMIDLVPGLAASVALDINHSAGITGSPTRAEGGTDTASLVSGSDVVVITAGRPRAPGMDRSELIETNGKVIRSVAEDVAEHAPNAVIVVVTNPLDEMTQQAAVASGFPREQVLGMAGTLDSSRFRAILARVAGVLPQDVEAFTLGSHGNEMVPIVSHARIKGQPLDQVMDIADIKKCVIETIGAGGQVVELRKTGSAYVAPAHAIAEVLDGLRRARVGPIPVSVRLDGEYGIEGVVIGVPTHLGPRGLEEVVEIDLTQAEREALQRAAAAVKARLEA